MQDSDTPDYSDLTIGALTLSIQQRVALHDNNAIALSPNAFALLLLLMKRSPAVVSVSEILEHVWKGKVVNKETVRQQILALREQLGTAGSYIQTVRGHGYQVLPPSTDEGHSPLTTSTTPQSKNWVNTVKDHWSSKGSGTKTITYLAIFTFILLLATAVIHLQPQQGKIELPVRVVVLPFEHIGLQDSALPRKIQDQLITALSHNRLARVMAVSVTDNATKGGFTHTDYAQRMNIDLIFEGAIYPTNEAATTQKEKDCVSNECRVNVRAIWTHDGATVWRESIATRDSDLATALEELTSRAQTFLERKTQYYLNQQ